MSDFYSYSSGNWSNTTTWAPAIVDGGFETPVIATNGFHNYTSAGGTAWTATGNTFLSNGTSAFGGPPQAGNQIGVIQDNGSFAQTFSFSSASYSLVFYCRLRKISEGDTGNTQTILVKLDGSTIQTITPTTTFVQYTVSLGSLSGSHTILLQGTATNDDSAFLDSVSLSGAPASVPGIGDTATIKDSAVVTVDVNTTVGTSPSDTTTNVLIGTGTGSVTVADGVTFQVRGNASVDNGVLQIGTGSTGGATLEFDASNAVTTTTTYKCSIGGNTKTSSLFKMRGTSGSAASILSNASGGNAQIIIDDGLFDCQYYSFTRIGDASNDGRQIQVQSATTGTHSFSHGTLSACGRLNTQSTLPAGMGLSISNEICSGGVGSADLRLIATAPSGGVTRSVDSSSYSVLVTFSEGSFALTNSVFDGEVGGAGSDVPWGTNDFENNFVRLLSTSGGGIIGMALTGDFKGNYVLADAGTDNPHILLPHDTGSSQVCQDCIIEYTSTISTDPGNCFYGVGTWTFQRNIVLLDVNASANAAGAITSAGGVGLFSVNHNTLYASTGTGGILLNDGGEATGEIPNCQSNIFWTEIGVGARGATRTSGGTSHDNPITPANCTNNAFLNPTSAPLYEGTYPTTQPGASDVQLTSTNPSAVFVDSTRNIATWAVTQGSSSGTYAGQVADARTYLKANPALIADLLDYVQAGFAVLYSPWRTAAADGTVVGAVQESPTTTLTISVSDNLAGQDAASRLASALRAIADNLGVSDTVKRLANAFRKIADNLGLSDAVSRKGTTKRKISDNLGITDTAKRLANAFRKIADNLGVTDAATISHSGSNTFTILVADSLGISDTFSRLATSKRSLSDSLALTDTVQRQTTALRKIADNLALADAVTIAVNWGRLATDNLGVSDMMQRTATNLRFIADTLAATDLATRQTTASRLVADNLGASDTVQRLANIFRQISDNFGAIDLATLAQTALVFRVIDLTGSFAPNRPLTGSNDTIHPLSGD